MRSANATWRAGVLALALATQCGHAQTLPPTLPSATESALHAMSRLAGVIFAGRVIAVRRDDGIGINGATGVVEIEFAVDDAIRGVSSGAYTLREWAGLWPAGDQPFRVGQRFLMLLHTPGPAGLSSPIGGTDGAIPIRGSAQPAVETGGRVVDLRWVATRAVRPASYQPASVAHPIGRPVTVHPNAAVASAAVGVESESSTATAAAFPDSDDITTVLAMLRTWERDDHATR